MRRALFVDRDGTLNIDSGYLHVPEDTVLLPGAVELVKAAGDLGALVIIVTNQSGVGRGYFSQDDFLAFDRWFREFFERFDAAIEATYFCPDVPPEENNFLSVLCRKPSPWMFFRAAKDFNLDLSESAMVGNAESDSDAAARAGVRNIYRIASNPSSDDSSLRPVIKSLYHLWGQG